MKTLKTTKPVKKVNSKKEVNLDQATIKAVADKVRPTTVKDKNFLYRFQVANLKATKKMTHKEEKKARNKIRRNLKLLINAIILDNMKKKDLSKIKDFILFYKDNYIMNDFSLKSLTNVTDKETIEDYNKVLNLCKEFKTK